ncbi:MAG: hypothetical protein AAF639_08635 [Chloroflexota bacterium]
MDKILWHPLWYKLLTPVLTPEDIIVQQEVLASVEPPKIDQLFLRNKGDYWNERQRAVLPDGVRDRHVKHHLFEIKMRQSLTEDSLQQALVYDYLYRQKQSLARDAIQTYVVCSITPQKARLQAMGFEEGEYPGVYVHKGAVLKRFVLIVLNQLRDEPHNIYFRAFASRKNIRTSAFSRLRQISQKVFNEIWDVLFALQKAYEIEEIDMQFNLTAESLMEMGQEMIHLIPVEKRLEGLTPEEQLLGLTPEEQLLGLTPEEQLLGLTPEERFIGLKPEERFAGLEPEQVPDMLNPKNIEAMFGPEILRQVTKIFMEPQQIESSVDQDENDRHSKTQA